MLSQGCDEFKVSFTSCLSVVGESLGVVVADDAVAPPIADAETVCEVKSAAREPQELGDLTRQLLGMHEWVLVAAEGGLPADVVERGLLQRVLAIGKALFQSYLTAVGPGDVGETLTQEDGRVLKRLPKQHDRNLSTIFGTFSISRVAYGTRERQKHERVPTDERLQLPEGAVSYPLQEWDQMLGVQSAFGVARDIIEQILAIRQSVDTLEHGNQQMAESTAAFRASQAAPDPAKEGAILVATEDNKGVPMVRPATAAPAGAHRKKGEKANKKQMACIGCVYTVDPHVRTAAELVKTLFREPDRSREKPPEAQQKRYCAELTRVIKGKEVRGQQRVFEHLRDGIKQRRRPGQILVNLCDGQRSLETDRRDYLPTDEHTVDILDLMHVNPRLWEAAHLFHTEGSPAATAFVRERVLRILEGDAKSVIAGLRQMGTKRGLKGSRKQRLKTACNFLERNLYRMKYDKYLAAGYPIASGVIEGACRHVIRDRMELAGMRWKIPGAQAMLDLRTLHANGDWKTYQTYRIQAETHRLYPHAHPTPTMKQQGVT